MQVNLDWSNRTCEFCQKTNDTQRLEILGKLEKLTEFFVCVACRMKLKRII